MIYSKDFVWLHFPKCAGTKVANLFKKYFANQADIHQDPRGPNAGPEVLWHDSIAEREERDPSFKLGSRRIICSFRTLPAWLESRYNFSVKMRPDFPHRPELLLEGKFYEAIGIQNHADYYVNKYLPQSLLKTGDVWFIRTEFFKSDFKTIFGQFLDISKIPEWEYSEKVNTTEMHLPIEIKKQLYDASTRGVYHHCPAWWAAEELAYGHI